MAFDAQGGCSVPRYSNARPERLRALAMLNPQPLTVFTTAFDQYALQAFEVNSIDYLLKPVEAQQLTRALAKLERLHAAEVRPDLKAVVAQLAEALRAPRAQYLSRIASRVGERV